MGDRFYGYGLVEVKALGPPGARVLRGVATTPAPDRQGHRIDPFGAVYRNPVPLLLDHDQTQQVGHAMLSAPSSAGIAFEATIATIDTPGHLKSLVDDAWAAVTSRLRAGVSIGYRVLADPVFDRVTKTYAYLQTEIVELSLVTIPANTDATVDLVKALDTAALRRSSPGVSGIRSGAAMSLYAGQIREFENKRAATVAGMDALMRAAADRSETLNPEETAQYDTYTKELAAIDVHLPRLREQEKLEALTATRVIAASADQGTGVRAAVPVISVKSRQEPGSAFARYTMAIAACNGNKHEAAEYARQRWHQTTPEVELAIKAAVAAGSTTDPAWAGVLATLKPLTDEFIELLRPQTLLGRIAGHRQVPFNVSVPRQTAGGTYQWVGQGAPKPVGKLAFDAVSLVIAKAAGIIVITEELARTSSPSAEATVRADMISGMRTYLDQQYIDPAVAPVPNVSPGSVTNGIAAITSSGTSPANARTDLLALMTAVIGAGHSASTCTFVMSETNAMAIGASMNPLGQPLFPGVGVTGGSFQGIPIVASQTAGPVVALICASDILLADDGGLTIDVSREASLQMDSAPANPADATTVMVSLWQNNLIGLRAERFINWKRAVNSAVAWTTQTYVAA